ncbi:sterol desaturase family protein [Umboniibacter marinipuniceus]|uniref:Sterol desaturase/sphingolipid hydroxylase (Fatty acid hydroxylase superfamily) n=1 Tax=Umboniibacter marinipuniceus TaxID=569599 RepID=A0A3M0ADB2_9GAMM|nr:sterol desaturase family protein [Umboniibacter marinipuniceus]RMA82497.1 sterol desaturase/sphingolipid hydroxylase (fatty acid hydroxylase superfamily) [Umboniibacter marinipuniceus]
MTSMIVFAAIPIFFILIGVEWWLDHRSGKHYMPFADAFGSLALGVWSISTKVILISIGGWIYLDLLSGVTLFSSIAMTPLMWLVAFVLYDFCYYWFHRISHECNFFWASHVVHHQSEEYNLTTALRQTSSGLFGFLFYFPLYIIGFSPSVIATVGAINLVYQFWVHTRYIDRLGWLDRVFVTPSNHRVHHGQNDVYIDKNHGGVLVVWDRLFGTFQDEIPGLKIAYGVTVPVRSLSPLAANLQVWKQMLRDIPRAANWREAFRLVFGRTGWRSESMQEDFPLAKTMARGGTLSRYQPSVEMPMIAYAAFQLTVCSLLATFFALNSASYNEPTLWLTWLLISTPLVTCARLMERRINSYRWECLRLLVSVMVVLALPLSLHIHLLLSYLIINCLALALLGHTMRGSEQYPSSSS